MKQLQAQALSVNTTFLSKNAVSLIKYAYLQRKWTFGKEKSASLAARNHFQAAGKSPGEDGRWMPADARDDSWVHEVHLRAKPLRKSTRPRLPLVLPSNCSVGECSERMDGLRVQETVGAVHEAAEVERGPLLLQPGVEAGDNVEHAGPDLHVTHPLMPMYPLLNM